MNYKKFRLSDVAQGAEVSLSTASRYFNGAKVRPSSAEKIQRYLEQHQE